MLLYLDDDIIEGLLVKLLRKAGHNVEIPADAGLASADDSVHLTHAIRTGRVLLSQNHKDFEQLHILVLEAQGHHPGVLIVRKDGDKRDLRPAGIVRTLARLLASGDPISDHYTILNYYR